MTARTPPAQQPKEPFNDIIEQWVVRAIQGRCPFAENGLCVSMELSCTICVKKNIHKKIETIRSRPSPAPSQQRIEQAIKELEEAKLSFTWPTSEKHIDKAIALLRGEEKP